MHNMCFIRIWFRRNEIDLEEKMRGSEFEFHGVNVLYYDLNKISLDLTIMTTNVVNML